MKFLTGLIGQLLARGSRYLTKLFLLDQMSWIFGNIIWIKKYIDIFKNKFFRTAALNREFSKKKRGFYKVLLTITRGSLWVFYKAFISELVDFLKMFHVFLLTKTCEVFKNIFYKDLSTKKKRAGTLFSRNASQITFVWLKIVALNFWRNLLTKNRWYFETISFQGPSDQI